MFCESFIKCSARLPYRFLLTVHPTTLVSINIISFIIFPVYFLTILSCLINVPDILIYHGYEFTPLFMINV